MLNITGFNSQVVKNTLQNQFSRYLDDSALNRLVAALGTTIRHKRETEKIAMGMLDTNNNDLVLFFLDVNIDYRRRKVFLGAYTMITQSFELVLATAINGRQRMMTTNSQSFRLTGFFKQCIIPIIPPPLLCLTSLTTLH